MNKNNLIITNRDLDVFKALTKYHLTGQMVFQLSKTFKHPFSDVNNTRARLSQLYKRGFLYRDQRLMKGRNSNENYYFLTKKSALFFEELREIEKNSIIFQPVKIGNQAHTFSVANTMVKVEQDIKEHQDICQLSGYIRENHFTVLGNGKRTIKPDGTIFVNINGMNFLLFLEVDLSTEVVSSLKPNVRTFERKIQIYSEFKNHFLQNEIIHSFEGITGYRVLIVCKTTQRLQNLVNLAGKLNKTNMFWFTTKDWIIKGNCLFDKIWVLPDGQFYPLF